MLKINDLVTVKPGIEDPDFGGDLGGWQGRITEIDNSNPDDVLVLIEWDACTIQHMHKAYLKKCFKEGYDHERMTLGISDVELTKEPTVIGDRTAVLNELDAAYHWEELGEQGLRIKAVEDACENDYAIMDHWFEYLEGHVTLPVPAEYIGERSGNLRSGAIIQINGFADTDDEYGVIGSAKYDKRWVQVPLCNIRVLESTPGTQALEDYIVWFAER